jgi:hypothetical protein
MTVVHPRLRIAAMRPFASQNSLGLPVIGLPAGGGDQRSV